MGSYIVEFNIRNITVKSQDQVIAVGKKGINLFLTIHSISLLLQRSIRH